MDRVRCDIPAGPGCQQHQKWADVLAVRVIYRFDGFAYGRDIAVKRFRKSLAEDSELLRDRFFYVSFIYHKSCFPNAKVRKSAD